MTHYFDNGLFWQTAPAEKRGRVEVARPLPAFDNDWRPPDLNNVNLSAAKMIAVDCETKDPELTTKGPGVRRGDSHIVGIAVGTDDGGRWYLPMRHEVGKEQNLAPDAVLAWAKDNLCNASQPKVGANLLYDLDFLYHEGVKVVGDFHDVLIAEPLIDEHARSYALDVLAEKYLGEGKVDEELYGWLAAAYGGKADRRSQARNIYRAPPSVVAAYAEGDVDLPFRIFSHQMQALRAEQLEDLYHIERRLVPVLLAMRRRGVRVDVAGAQRLDHTLVERASELKKELEAVGITSANSALQIAPYCDKMGIIYPRTALGAPSFNKDYLAIQEDRILSVVREVRKLEKFAGTFLDGYVEKHHVNGRIHCEFHQLRGDAYGTVSGRFCVHGDTVLQTNRGDFKIKDYAPKFGDTVVTHTGQRKRVLRRIYKGVERMVRVDFEGGQFIIGTLNHRILTVDGWKSLRNITTEDRVYGYNERNAPDHAYLAGFKTTRVKATILVGPSDVWDIEVEEDHSYLAQGLIHHNSSSNPNLQNIPARDEEIGPLIRGLFLPDEGEDWYSDDWSQIEYRLLVHYGKGPSADKTRDAYWTDPNVDFHQYVADIANVPRKFAKNINFGLVYGMGEKTMASNLGRTIEDVKPIFDQYHATFPFIKQLYNNVDRVAAYRGHIKTLLGRRRRFIHWVPMNWKEEREMFAAGGHPLLEDEAKATWGEGKIRRYDTKKALNGLLQGGAADLMKLSMVKIWESGVCDVLGAPLLTVHDELNWSVPRTPQAMEARKEVVHIMENCFTLTVPLKCDAGHGANWGEAKD